MFKFQNSINLFFNYTLINFNFISHNFNRQNTKNEDQFKIHSFQWVNQKRTLLFLIRSTFKQAIHHYYYIQHIQKKYLDKIEKEIHILKMLSFIIMALVVSNFLVLQVFWVQFLVSFQLIMMLLFGQQ